MNINLIVFLFFICSTNAISQNIMSFDSLFHEPVVLKDSTGYRMLITVKHKKSNLIDTLYNNYKPFNPVYLHFIKKTDNHIIILTESERLFAYKVYKINSIGRWEYNKSELLGYKSRYLPSTTIEIIDYFNIKIRNGEGDFLWNYDIASDKFTKTEITSGSH
jgi:hypothetical protein